MLLMLILVPMGAQAKKSEDVDRYLVGAWQVDAIKERDATAYHAPHRPMKWVFTSKGELIETLGKSGAQVHWQYRVSGRDIKVQLGNMGFRWHIIAMQPQAMLIQHQRGLYKVSRLAPALAH
ncbi:MAG: hypothetical protein GC149_11435 [Gammaproteobacteria bacterium]|nr:hypothetical protein [Gammaproteobacteria bacterium]